MKEPEHLPLPPELNGQALARIFAHSHAGMVVVNRQATITRFNHAFSELLGYDEDEMTGLNLHQLTHPFDWRVNGTLYYERERWKMESFHVEKRFIRKNKEVVWVHKVVNRIANEEGDTVGYTGMAFDITALKHRLTDLQLIEISRRKMGQLLNHEIRGPVTSMVGLMQLVKAGKISHEEFSVLCSSILASSETIVQNLDSIINWSEHHLNQFMVRRSSFLVEMIL